MTDGLEIPPVVVLGINFVLLMCSLLAFAHAVRLFVHGVRIMARPISILLEPMSYDFCVAPQSFGAPTFQRSHRFPAHAIVAQHYHAHLHARC